MREGEQPLQKKGRGRLIHVSDFINEEDGRLVLLDETGRIIRDARKIIYPGSNGDSWWDTDQLLVQVESAMEIFEAAHPDCQALFVFDQSSAHASLPPDALKAFTMNKSNGGAQRKQKNTVIPQSNPDPQFHGVHQEMITLQGEAKGLKDCLEERGFDVARMKAKCSPVCPFESQNCCMARLLSQQEDFVDQPSMLELMIKKKGHECIFLPKFHCELNPIEMVSSTSVILNKDHQLINWLSTGDGANTDIGRHQKQILQGQKRKLLMFLMHAHQKSFGDLSIGHGDLLMPIEMG